MAALKPSELITDEEIIKVHANANFGDQTPREVVNEAVLKYAFGYSSGSTALSILREHGLVRRPRMGSYKTTLTQKGFRYLRALYDGKFREIYSLAEEES